MLEGKGSNCLAEGFPVILARVGGVLGAAPPRPTIWVQCLCGLHGPRPAHNSIWCRFPLGSHSGRSLLLPLVFRLQIPMRNDKGPVPPPLVMLTNRFWVLALSSKANIAVTCLHPPLASQSAEHRQRPSGTQASVCFDSTTFLPDLGVFGGCWTPRHPGNSSSDACASEHLPSDVCGQATAHLLTQTAGPRPHLLPCRILLLAWFLVSTLGEPSREQTPLFGDLFPAFQRL